MSRHSTLVVAAFALVVGPLARPAPCANQLVLGKVFLVVNPDAGDAAKRRVKVIGREASGASTIVGNPTAGGASLLVAANGATDSSATFTLPAGGWSASATGFTYHDPAGVNGPVRVAVIRDTTYGGFLVKAVLVGSLGPGPQPHIPVVPPAPGTDGGATLTIVGGDAYCVRFGAGAGGQVTNAPPPTGTRVFKVRNATAEAGCVQCSDQGGTCGGLCGPMQFCADLGGGNCQCLFIFGTTTIPPTTSTTSSSTTTSTSSTSSSTVGSPSGAFLN